VAEETSLREIALLFLRLGATSFGGPAAHVAMMEEEVVRRRGWLTRDRFLDLLGMANLIPGPNSTELAIHIGFERRRWAGLVVAGLSFLVPAVLVTGLIARAYVTYGKLPEAGWLLYGVKPAILGVVVQAIVSLAPKAASDLRLRLLGLAAILLAAFGVNELVVLFGAGVVSLLLAERPGTRGGTTLLALGPLLPAAALPALPAAAGPTALSLFLVFAKIGSVLFGSGYVLLAFLRADLVGRLGWLTEAQLVDAIAAGQITPGPVFSSATFVGYLLLGPAGAAAATAGIFLPAFVFVALSGPLLPRLRRSPRAGAFLSGVNVASLALMVVVTGWLARSSLVDVPALVVFLVSTGVLVRFRPNATWVVLGGAVAGWLVRVVTG
jgi:chromate transporter